MIQATVLQLPGTDSFSTSFLIDSGAYSTVLSGIDAVQSGFLDEIESSDDDIADYFPKEANIDEIASEGIGGTTDAYRVNDSVMLSFTEQADSQPANLHVEVLDGIVIVPESPRSLLGRDILNRFDATFSYVNDEVELKRNTFGEGACMDITLNEQAMAAIQGLP